MGEGAGRKRGRTSSESQRGPGSGGSQRDCISPSAPHPRHCAFLGEETEAERSRTLPSGQKGCDSGAFWRTLESDFILLTEPSTSSQET